MEGERISGVFPPEHAEYLRAQSKKLGWPIILVLREMVREAMLRDRADAPRRDARGEGEDPR